MMKRKNVRITGILLTVIMLVTMLGVFALTAFAAEAVSYIECSWDGSAVVKTTKEVTNYTVVTSSTTTMTDGWYVVNSDVNHNNSEYQYVEVTIEKATPTLTVTSPVRRCSRGTRLN